MRILNLFGVCKVVLLFLVGAVMFNGCDSGEKVVEKVTGKVLKTM